MTSTFREAAEADAVPLAALHNAVADHLTARFGKGHWSFHSSERGVLYDLKIARVLVQVDESGIVGTFKLGTRKPWAIDTSYFTPVTRPLYLQSMAVHPELQRQGFGRALLDQAREVAKAWPADAIRLDAYDADAGAGEFYAKCGFCEAGRANYRNTPLVYFELLLR
jgi:ribosomal protein S18 acetylase RimI-like enzyme